MNPINNYLALDNYKYNNSPKLDTRSNDDTKLKEQCDKFEAIFVKMWLDKAMPETDSLYPKQAGHKIYKSMYIEALSEDISGHYGFSQMLFDYLKEQQK